MGLALLALAGCSGRQAVSPDSTIHVADGGGSTDAVQVADLGPPSCTSNDECPPDGYCHRGLGCEGSGECRARPEGCPEDCPSVCGCDGQDYCNTCAAHAAGINVADLQPCYVPFGCEDDSWCNGGSELCDLPGGCLSYGGPHGICVERPESCPEVGPCPWVCGCDGQSYCTACEAHMQGVELDESVSGPCLSCNELAAEYLVELQQIKQCSPQDPSLHCQHHVDDKLTCPCPTSTEQPASAKMQQLAQQWLLQGCTIPCPPVPCPVPGGASCQPAPSGGSGSCVDSVGP